MTTCWVRGALFFVARWQAFCLIFFGNLKRALAFEKVLQSSICKSHFRFFSVSNPSPRNCTMSHLVSSKPCKITTRLRLFIALTFGSCHYERLNEVLNSLPKRNRSREKATLAWRSLRWLGGFCWYYPLVREIHNQYSLEESCVLYVISIFICNMFFISSCRLRYSPFLEEFQGFFRGVPRIRLDFLDAHWMLKWRAEHATNPRNPIMSHFPFVCFPLRCSFVGIVQPWWEIGSTAFVWRLLVSRPIHLRRRVY